MQTTQKTVRAVWAVVATLLFALTGQVAAAHAQDEFDTPDRGSGRGDVRVRVNGERVRFPTQGPVEEGGRVLVPLRGVLEKLGAFVEYDSATKDITAVRNETRIEMQVGSRRARVDGRNVRLDAPARVLNGAVLVPLRFVGEALGADVRYVAARRTVEINTGDNPNPIPDPEPDPDPEPSPRSVSGTVRSTQAATVPRVIVVRPNNGGEARTIRLEDAARVRILDGDGDRPYTFGRINRGDRVRVELNARGRATSILVTVVL